jgi:uncharacterized protein (DUF362 family)
MPTRFSRRALFQFAAGAGALSVVRGQDLVSSQPSVASIIKGEDRRKNIFNSLVAIDDQILPALKRKKYVVIKPNLVNLHNQLASTHPDAIAGILDYLEPRFKGPVVIAESSAGDTEVAYENFKYNRLVTEHASQKVQLIDLNEEGKYNVINLLDFDIHPVPVRLAARLMDPDAFIFCSAIMKTHNTVVASLSIKNMCLGAPLHSSRKETARWHDKRKYHNGVRQTQYNIFLTAKALQPFWGAAVIDGFEGMEGNGPSSGTPVPSRIAVASTDYIAADRVALETMGIDATWVGYLQFCQMFGLGQGDLGKVDVRGEKIAAVQKKYRQHKDIELQLQWMGPIKDLPPKLG